MKTNALKFLCCMAMLLASMNVMAQRETMKFSGTIFNFPHGGSSAATLTVSPDNKFVLSIKGGKTVSAFTIKGQHNANATYNMPGSNGEKGVKADGAVWAMQVTEWSAFKNDKSKFSPAKAKIMGSLSGRTEGKKIKLNINLKGLLPDGRPFTLPLQCTFDK